MADKRVFTIEINGVEESYKNVKSLKDILDELNSTEKKIVTTQKEVTEASQQKIKELTEEEKIQKRLDDLEKRIAYTKTDLAEKEARLREKLRKSNADLKERVTQNTNVEESSKKVRVELTEQEKAEKRLNDLRDKINTSKSEAAQTEANLREELRLSNVELREKARVNKSAEGSIASLEAQLKRLRTEYKNLSKEQQNSDNGRKMLADIQRLSKETKEYNKTLGVSSDFISRLEDSIKSALGINNEFAQSLLNISKNDNGKSGLSAFFDNAGKSVQSFGKMLLGLLTNPVFIAIAGIAGAGLAFKFWYDYNKGLEEATRLTKQFTGLAGNELKAFRNEVSGVADTFGKEYKETLEASNAVAKQFGISQQEALNDIKDGFIAGADANGRFLDILREYPTFFNEAGISAREFIAITAETQNEGVFSDKGIDAIKEANIRLREMSTSTVSALEGIGISSKQVQEDLRTGAKTTFDVIQEISTKLGEFPDQSKEVGTAIADIFGGAGEDAGLQFIRTLKDIDTNLDNVKKKTGELGEIQERQMRANIELQNAVSALFDQTGGTFETMIGNAKIFVTESLTSIITGLVKLINYFIDLYNNVQLIRGGITTLVSVFKILWEAGTSVIDSLIESFKTLARVISAALKGEFSSISGIVKQSNNDIRNNFVQTFNDIKKIAKDSLEEISNGRIEPIEIPVNIVPDTLAGNGVGNVVDGLKDENEEIKGVVKEREDIFKSLEKILNDAWKRIQEEHRKNLERELQENTDAGNKEILRLTNQYKDQLITKEQYEAQMLQISIDRLQSEIAIREKFGQDTTELQIRLSNLLIRQSQSASSAIETDEDRIKKVIENITDYTQKISMAINSIFDGFNSILQMQMDEANERLDEITQRYDEVVQKREESEEIIADLEERAKDARGGRLIALQEQIAAQMDVNNKLAAQEKQLARDKEKQEREVAKREKQQKRAQLLSDISSATATTALAVVGALGSRPWTPANIVLAAIVGAMGALQVGVMSAQLAKLEDGGLLKGKRHSDGGMRIEGTNIEVEGGEYVVNRVSTAKNLGLIRYINAQRKELSPDDVNAYFDGGRSYEPPFRKMFEAGGMLPNIENTIAVDNAAIVDAISAIDFEPVVAVTDINRTQKDIVRVDDWTDM